MGNRGPWLLGLLPVALLAAFLVQPRDVPPPAATETPPLTEPAQQAPSAAAIGAVAQRAPQRADQRDHWWVRNLSEREPPLLAAAEDDPTAQVLHGRLTVRQRQWLHPAGVELRLTRTWLDTVLPVDTGAEDQVVPERREPTATTDQDGRFTLRLQATRGDLFLLVDHAGPWSDFQKLDRVPRPGTTLDVGEVYLDDRGGVTGQLLGVDGRPLGGAVVRAVDDPLLDPQAGLGEVQQERNRGLDLFRATGSLRSGPVPDWVARRDRLLPFPQATTDVEGRFRLVGLRPGSHDLFCQHATGHGSVRGVLVAGLRDTHLGALRLRANTPVELTFVSERGRPWVGAEIALVHRDLGFGPPLLRTDAAGMVRTLVAEPERAQVLFAYPGGGPWLRVADVRMPHARIEVPSPPEVTITLLDVQQNRVPNARVRCFVQGEAFRPVDRALPASMQPVERRPGVHVGSWPCAMVAVASAPGFAPAIAAVARDLTMTMLPLHTVTVRTHDAKGNPVAGAAVRIQAHRNPSFEFAGAQWDLLANDRVLVGNTDEDGLLQVPVWETPLSLQAEHPAFAPSPGPKLVPVPGERIDLLLRKAAVLSGHLTLHQRPAAAGYRVRARQKPPPGHVLEGSGWLDDQIAVVGALGAFEFRGLVAGIWELQPELPSLPSVRGAREPGSNFLAKQFMLDEGQEVYCPLEAEVGALAVPQLTGTVRRDGIQVQGALVRLRPLDSEPAPRSRRGARQRPGRQEPVVSSAAFTHRLVTDAFGDFGFADLDPNTDYELRVDVPWQDRLQFVERRVLQQNDLRLPKARIDVEWRTGSIRLSCSLAGRVYDNRMLRLRQVGADGQEGARFEVLTSPIGECLVEQLPAGRWTVEPMFGGFCQPAEFSVAAGETPALAIEILP